MELHIRRLGNVFLGSWGFSLIDAAPSGLFISRIVEKKKESMCVCEKPHIAYAAMYSYHHRRRHRECTKRIDESHPPKHLIACTIRLSRAKSFNSPVLSRRSINAIIPSRFSSQSSTQKQPKPSLTFQQRSTSPSAPRRVKPSHSLPQPPRSSPLP